MYKSSLKFAVAGVVFLTSCVSNKELVTYQLEGKNKIVTIGQALDVLDPVLKGASPQNLDFILNSPDILRQGVSSMALEQELLLLEALKISNFLEDPKYKESLAKQAELMPYYVAMQKGQETLLKMADDIKIGVAEISRIMFTNGNLAEAQAVLDQLKAEEDPLAAFPNVAAEYSQEGLGMQTGGYLGLVDETTYPDLKEVVFVQKAKKGLYPEVVEGELIDGVPNLYILYINTPVKIEKYKDIKDKSFAIQPTPLLLDYINKNAEFLFIREGDNVTVGNKTYTVADFPKDVKIVNLWDKKYSINDLLVAFEFFGIGLTAESESVAFLSALSENNMLVELAVLFKGYTPSLKNSKEVKELIVNENKQLKLQSASEILSAILFTAESTNVTDEELRLAYENPETRPVASYDANDNPIYATFEQAKEQLSSNLINQKAAQIQGAYIAQMLQNYNVVWNEPGFEILQKEIKRRYVDNRKALPEGHSYDDGHNH